MKQSSYKPSRAIASVHSTANGLTVSGRRWELLFGALLIAVTLLVYQPAWNGTMLTDDVDHMITTRQSRSLQGLSDLWLAPHTTRQYHPLLDTVYWIEANLWGQSYLGYHLVTLSLHAISVLLLWSILRRLKIPAAWLAAAIFALHPVHVESVAWMVELKNTLSGFFFFAALLAYLQFDEKRTAKWYLLVVVLFVMGILVKAIVATLPAVVLLILWWQRRKLNWKRDIQPLIPFLVLGAAAGLLTAWMERAFAGAEGEEFEFSPIDRVLIAGRAFWFYLAKVFWPTNLTLIYPRWKVD
jgi:4-amino-4-deoxy-L-arabinose transferase-like glycosyltransferase